MQNFLIDLLIVIGLVWLTQTLIGAFGLRDPAGKILFSIVLVLLVLWLITGSLTLLVR